MSKPHLVLNWLFDIPNQTLKCKINDNLEYEALEGGDKGYIKRYRRDSKSKLIESKITPSEWEMTEKFWISDWFGDLVGHYQPDPTRVGTHVRENRPDHCPNGIGPDGRYLDHMQRMQAILEGEDCAVIAHSPGGKILFTTPDCGKTIFKRLSTRDVNYEQVKTDPNLTWPEHSQPCMMQPRSPGSRLSSYQEMLDAGINEDIIAKCKNGKWDKPPHPELQKWYIYPTK